MSKNQKDKNSRVFYLCNGEVPYCGKHTCYKSENPPDEPCRHTTDIAHAINFRKENPGGRASYWETVCDKGGGMVGSNE